MAIYTGKLSDFTTTPLSPNVVITFTPSNPATYQPFDLGFIFITKPIKVFPDAGGDFSVNLFINADARPDSHYTIDVTWLDSASNFIRQDFLPGRYRAAPDGGTIADLLVTEWNPTLAFVGPDTPLGVPVESSLWLDTDSPNADLLIWSK